jgi:hypothetical protein
MFRPLYMAIFRFSVLYSVRKCLFLVGPGGGGVRSYFKMYGLGLLLLSICGVLHMGGYLRGCNL